MVAWLSSWPIHTGCVPAPVPGFGLPVWASDRHGSRSTTPCPTVRSTPSEARFALIWPEQLEGWLSRSGLALQRMLGWPDRDLAGCPTFYGLAGKVSRGAVLDA